MTVTVKNKTPLVVPPSIRRRAGWKPGDELEFRAAGGVITITAKPESASHDDYTPGQRKYIDARLKKALGEVEEGKTIGPFNTAAEVIASMEADVKKLRAAKRKKRGG